MQMGSYRIQMESYIESKWIQMGPMETKWDPKESKWDPMESKWNPMESNWDHIEAKWDPNGIL